MQIKKKQIKGCYSCGSKILKLEKDIRGKKYAKTCSICNTINRKIINYCPYCNSIDYEKWGENVRNFSSVKCKKCKIVYLKNPLSNDAQSLYYKNYLNNVHQKKNVKKKQRTIMYKHELDYLIDSIEDFTKINDVLDVGCGGGYFLDLFKKKRKKTYGVEVGLDSYLTAKKKHTMFYGEFNEKLNIKKKFDLIVMRGVIEHVDDPKQYVHYAQKILKKSGYILITATPNLDCISAEIFKERWTQHRPESHILHLKESHVDQLFSKKKFTKYGSKSLYLNTPYENFFKDISIILKEIQKQKKGIKSSLTSPAFFGNMMTLIYKKK